jgi:hypothetical protein
LRRQLPLTLASDRLEEVLRGFFTDHHATIADDARQQ